MRASRPNRRSCSTGPVSKEATGAQVGLRRARQRVVLEGEQRERSFLVGGRRREIDVLAVGVAHRVVVALLDAGETDACGAEQGPGAGLALENGRQRRLLARVAVPVGVGVVRLEIDAAELGCRLDGAEVRQEAPARVPLVGGDEVADQRQFGATVEAERVGRRQHAAHALVEVVVPLAAFDSSDDAPGVTAVEHVPDVRRCPDPHLVGKPEARFSHSLAGTLGDVVQQPARARAAVERG